MSSLYTIFVGELIGRLQQESFTDTLVYIVKNWYCYDLQIFQSWCNDFGSLLQSQRKQWRKLIKRLSCEDSDGAANIDLTSTHTPLLIIFTCVSILDFATDTITYLPNSFSLSYLSFLIHWLLERLFLSKMKFEQRS